MWVWASRTIGCASAATRSPVVQSARLLLASVCASLLNWDDPVGFLGLACVAQPMSKALAFKTRRAAGARAGGSEEQAIRQHLADTRSGAVFDIAPEMSLKRATTEHLQLKTASGWSWGALLTN